MAGVVDQIARREVVGAVDDVVVLPDDLHRVLGRQRRFVRHDFDVRVVGVDRLLRRYDLRLPDVVVLVEDLPLQVRDIDRVEVDDADLSDAGERQIHGDRRTETARTDDQRARFHDLALTARPHLRHDDMP